MSIFSKEPNVKESDWHYKLLDLLWLDSQKPKTQCSYGWTVVGLLVIFPLWAPAAYFNRWCGHIQDGFKISTAMTLAGYTCAFVLLWALGGVLLLVNDFFSLEILTQDMLWIEPPSDGDAGTMTWVGVWFTSAAMTELIAFLLVVVVGVWKGLVWSLSKLFNSFNNWMERKSSNRKYEVKEKEEQYTLFSSLVGWASDKKNKVCKEITYIKDEE